MPPPARSGPELIEANRLFYDPLWTETQLVEPERFNTWPLVRSLLASCPRRLEVAPGLRPRLPIDGSEFVDISVPAVSKLRARGASAALGSISALPFEDEAFELLVAFDVVEHLDDDEGALAELSRVAAPGATLLLSVPLHTSRWTAFDELVGHRRRYEPDEIVAKLARHGLTVTESAVYGMQPASTVLLDLGVWFLRNRREKAMWWYNHVFMPLAVRFQEALVLGPGLIDTAGVDEILIVCRKHARA